MTSIDFKKLIAQEPDFADFAKVVIFDAMIASNESFIKALYSFYQVGMTTEQVTQWFVANMKLNDP